VLFLSGAPGDPIVGLHHLKQPAGEVGPLKIIHDQTSGRTTVWNAVSLLQLAGQPGGISAADAAKALFDVEKPNPAEKEKVRRKLEKLQRDGQLVVLEAGDSAAKKATRWGLR